MVGDADATVGRWLDQTEQAVFVVTTRDVLGSAGETSFPLSPMSPDEAIELFTGVPAGVPDAKGDYPPDTVYGRIAAQLVAFDRALDARSRD